MINLINIEQTIFSARESEFVLFDTSLLVLSVMNWLHLMATVIWIGGMSTNILLLLPSAKEVLEPPLAGKLIGAVMKRYRIIVYISIIVLVASGMSITFLSEEYLGAMQFSNLWNQVMLIKHIFVAVLIILAIYAFEVVAPKVSRLAAKGPSPELINLQKLQLNMALVGFVLGIIILLLTSVAAAI